MVVDKWSQKYCSEYFNVTEYLAKTTHELKKVGLRLVTLAPKETKTVTNQTLHLVTSFYKNCNFSR